MKKTLIVANWKEHKTTSEAKIWLAQISHDSWDVAEKEIILCPSFTLLPLVKAEIERLRLPIKLGSQDFPAFDDGAYTGEESPRLLKEFIDYAIVGHSERREYFGESDDICNKKVTLAKQYGIEPIFCVQDKDTFIPQNTTIIAYEPIFAIGSGISDTPEKANAIAEEISKQISDSIILYGGSVTDTNVTSFISQSSLSGVLVGSNSLDPVGFSQIVSR